MNTIKMHENEIHSTQDVTDCFRTMHGRIWKKSTFDGIWRISLHDSYINCAYDTKDFTTHCSDKLYWLTWKNGLTEYRIGLTYNDWWTLRQWSRFAWSKRKMLDSIREMDFESLKKLPWLNRYDNVFCLNYGGVGEGKVFVRMEDIGISAEIKINGNELSFNKIYKTLD